VVLLVIMDDVCRLVNSNIVVVLIRWSDVMIDG
jgi:hypothetical protein